MRVLQDGVEKIQLFVSEAVIEETLGVMRDEFGRSAEQIEEARQSHPIRAHVVS
jgi:hypothetical protein